MWDTPVYLKGTLMLIGYQILMRPNPQVDLFFLLVGLPSLGSHPSRPV
ncbi:hypothetical protein MtrunA17_Chr4g0009321 [Medicago truncatula]|uniref:Uncharacterized protein n=1 Tax=Medicago truncatula TaxID=3880 RepID=A0A396I2L9_MEDTR|nr:hypothetical protein MtrunA17_Chr4g0009321 [Medicago truncatula]